MTRRLTHRQTRSSRRFCLAFAAGLLALVLQVLTPALPPAAMARAMDLAAATSAEAASFAATCLGLGTFDPDRPTVPGQQGKCPICVSMAQAQAFLPAPVLTVATIAWTGVTPPRPAMALVEQAAASPFASRAPPVA